MENTTPRYQYMPALTRDEEAGLRESIRTHGVLQAVLTDEDGNIIDGHNRARLADELGQAYIPEVVTGLSEDAKIDLAFSNNLAHRHMNTAQKREAIKRYLELRPDITDNGAAQLLGVSHNTVISVRTEMKAATSNRQIDNKDSDTKTAEPERREATGRRARGRQPLSPEERQAREDKRAADRERTVRARAAEKAAQAEQEARWREEQESIGGAMARPRTRKPGPGNYDRIKRAVDAANIALLRIQNDPGWEDAGLLEIDSERAVPNRLDTAITEMGGVARTIRRYYNDLL